MATPVEAYRQGYERGRYDTAGGRLAQITMGMLRDDPGGHFQKGYSDGAAGRSFSPPSIRTPRRPQTDRLIPKFSENPFGWFLGVIIVAELWALWQLIKAPFQLIGAITRSEKPPAWVVVKNIIIAGLVIGSLWLSHTGPQGSVGLSRIFRISAASPTISAPPVTQNPASQVPATTTAAPPPDLAQVPQQQVHQELVASSVQQETAAEVPAGILNRIPGLYRAGSDATWQSGNACTGAQWQMTQPQSAQESVVTVTRNQQGALFLTMDGVGGNQLPHLVYQLSIAEVAAGRVIASGGPATQGWNAPSGISAPARLEGQITFSSDASGHLEMSGQIIFTASIGNTGQYCATTFRDIYNLQHLSSN